MRLLSLFFILCFPLFLSAQIGWVKGYIITNTLDTLHGKILYSTEGQRSAKCTFKQDGYDDKVKYKPFTIRGYYVKDQYYISKVFDIHPSLTYGWGVFMRVVNIGESPVTILNYRNTDFEYGYSQVFLVKIGEPSHEIDPMRSASPVLQPTQPAALESLIQRLSRNALKVSADEIMEAQSLIQQLATSQQPGDEVIDVLDEIDALLPAPRLPAPRSPRR